MRGKLVFHLLYDVSQNKFITQKKIIELSKRRIIKEFWVERDEGLYCLQLQGSILHEYYS